MDKEYIFVNYENKILYFVIDIDKILPLFGCRKQYFLVKTVYLTCIYNPKTSRV